MNCLFLFVFFLLNLNKGDFARIFKVTSVISVVKHDEIGTVIYCIIHIMKIHAPSIYLISKIEH